MISLRTLGPLSLEREDGAPLDSILAQPKRLALLAYLSAANPPATSSRDTLLALLWPDLDESHARKALRQGLHLLRRALDPGLITGTGDERVGVDASLLWCDAAAFSQALAAGDPSGALALYRGPFLDGFHVSDAPEFERWVERQRHRLERDAVAAACQLVDVAEAAGERAGGRRWAERTLELAPYDEEIFRRYLGVLERQADAPTAVAAFAHYERRLAADLDLAPSTETVAAVARIRAGGAAALGKRPVVPSLPAEVPSLGKRPVVPPLPAEAPSASATPDSPAAGGVDRPSPGAPTRALKRPPRWLRSIAGVAAVAIIAGAFQLVHLRTKRAAAARRRAIAVLPFRDLSSDSSHAYLAAGLHDELLADLSKVSSLRVVGRTSVSAYQQTTKPLREIAQELGVGSVVEGSVEVVGNRLRVVVELADPIAGTNLWVERYERPLDDAFAVQSEIAQRILDAIGTSLTGTEAGAIRTPPTRDPTAYDLYLQGLEYDRRPAHRREDIAAAAELYRHALVLDSTFGPAHAALAIMYWQMHSLGYDGDPARLALAEAEAEAALRFSPGSPRAHLAIGLTRHLAHGDARGALEEFKLGVRSDPNDAELWSWVGRDYRRLGRWDSAFIAFDEAHRLEPRDASVWFSIAETRHYLHEYPLAIEAYRQALEMAPDHRQAHLALAWSYFLWKGQLDTLRAVLREMPEERDPGAGGESTLIQRATLFQWSRQPDSLLSLVRFARATGSTGPLTRAVLTAQAQTLRGDPAATRLAWDAARILLDSALRTAPGDAGLHATRGMALALVGRRSEALQEARWLAQSDAYRNDRFKDGWLFAPRARILARAGAMDAAFVEIERALSRPSLTTVHELRLSPDYDGFRRDPRFQALLQKYADPALR